MTDPYTKAEDQLVDDLNAGRITEADFRYEMRLMREEIQAEAEDAAREAYDDVMGRW